MRLGNQAEQADSPAQAIANAWGMRGGRGVKAGYFEKTERETGLDQLGMQSSRCVSKGTKATQSMKPWVRAETKRPSTTYYSAVVLDEIPYPSIFRATSHSILDFGDVLHLSTHTEYASVVEQSRSTRLARDVNNIMIVGESIEFGSAALGVGTHPLEVQPVTYI